MIPEKQKLTLSVERGIVEKAKKLGINISELTETFLKHVSEAEIKGVGTKDEINVAYNKIFDAMIPALIKFNASVVIGEEVSYRAKDHKSPEYMNVELLPSGDLWLPDFEETTTIENISLASPKKILSSFITSLVKASERNKEDIKQLEIFRRVIEAITETTVSENNKEKNPRNTI